MSALVELTKPKKRGKQSPTEAQLQAKRDKAAERKRNQRARDKARKHAFVPGQPCSITIKLTASESAYLGKAMKLRSVPQLHFHYDESITRGTHLSALIERAISEDSKHQDD